MDYTFKDALRRNRTYLLDGLGDPVEIIDYLIQEDKLTQEQAESLNSRRYRKETVRELLDILNFNEGAFDKFCKKLSDSENTIHIYMELERDKTLFISEHHLKQCYKVGENSTSVLDLLKDIKQILPEHQRREITLDILKELVRENFPQVTWNFDRSTIEKLEKIAIPDSQVETPNQSNMALLTTETDQWTTDDVQSWLRTINIDEGEIQRLREQKIDGEALRYIIEDNNANLNIPLGPAIKIKRKFQMLYKKTKPGGTPSGATATKSLSKTVPVDRPGFEEGSLYQQAGSCHYRFAEINLQEDHEKLQLARELVKHVCASMNERICVTFVNGVSQSEEINGIRVTEQESLAEFCKVHLKKSFYDQQGIVIQCVSEPVLTAIVCKGIPTGKYLCEVSINPHEEICMDSIFYVKIPKPIGKKGKKVAYKYQNKQFAPLKKTEICEYKERFQEKQNQIPVPKCAEAETPSVNVESNYLGKTENCTTEDFQSDNRPDEMASSVVPSIQNNEDGGSNVQRLQSLIRLEEDDVIGDIYPILFVNAPNKDINPEGNDDLSYIGQIPWKAVFDFDADLGTYTSAKQKEVNLIRVVPDVELFNEKLPSNVNDNTVLKEIRNDVEQTIEDHMKNEYGGPLWIFSNGYAIAGKEKLDVKQWKKLKQTGMKAAIKQFDYLIPAGHALAVIMILSDETNVFLEAMAEVISVFSDQWVIIGKEVHYCHALTELQRRNCIDADMVKERIFSGLSCLEVHNAFACTLGVSDDDHCQIPFKRNGKVETIEICNKDLRYLRDIEIVSTNKCDKFYRMNNFDKRNALLQQEELKYYNGADVSWLNFEAENHVFERDVVKSLQSKVELAITPDVIEERPIGKIMFYHQPGAGGTTAAKNVLWNLHKRYRCVVLKHISKETSNQVETIWKKGYEESQCHSEPVIVLADNIDDDSLNLLLAEMVEKAKQLVRPINQENPCSVFVFLVCVRKTDLPPFDKANNKCVLGQRLSPKELTWWRNKYAQLEERCNDKTISEDRRVKPNLLISFNIMKSDFNPEEIKKLAQRYVRSITSKKELELLGYVAIVNFLI